MKQVTQKEVAAELGVSVMTVSLGLRNSPKLPVATRRAVREAAERMGYKPDPALGALVSYRRRKHLRKDYDTIGFVTKWSTATQWRRSFITPIYAGVERGAAATGFQVKPIWLGDYTSDRAAGKSLAYQGIKGLIIAPFPEGYGEIEMDWAPFSLVAIGNPLRSVRLPRARHDYAASTETAMAKIKAAGYRKVALVLPRRADEISERRISSMFLAERDRTPALRKSLMWLPRPHEENQEAFASWINKHRPDCILSNKGEHLLYLGKSGLKVPEDIGYVSLRIDPHAPDVSGIIYRAEEVGIAAVQMLETRMQANLTGVPEWSPQSSSCPATGRMEPRCVRARPGLIRIAAWRALFGTTFRLADGLEPAASPFDVNTSADASAGREANRSQFRAARDCPVRGQLRRCRRG